jgi:acetyltransferase-like isoleucine patch superfamily enzyme
MFYIRGICKFNTFLFRCFGKFNYLGQNVSIHPTCDIQRRATPYVRIEDDVLISKHVWLNIPHEADPPNPEKPIIRIGRNSAVGRRCTISGVRSIEIGENVLFGPNVFVTDHSHNFEDPNLPIIEQGISEPGSVVIEAGTWLGHGCCVIAPRGREVRIGKNSVVGANAVVTKSFPESSVLVGLPARNVGKVVRGTL